MFRSKKQGYRPLPKEKQRYKQRSNVTENQYIQTCDSSKDPILLQGNLCSQLVPVPSNISFTEALDKVRQCTQNIQFYVTELENKLVFLHESLENLNSLKPSGSQKAYVTSPKTSQEIEILLRDNRETIENITRQGGSIIFPRKDQLRSATYPPEPKTEPKRSSRRHSNSSYTIESGHSSISEPILPKNKTQKRPQICHKGPQKHPIKPKRQSHIKVGKNSSCKYPEGDNFEQFVQKVMTSLDNTKITK